MISAITPIAIPQGRAADLDPAVIRRLASGPFSVFQLDATAYPGSSGSPIYDPATGDVLGIVNMVFVKGTKETALSQPSGITYAIPSRHLAGVAGERCEPAGGEVAARVARLGATLADRRLDVRDDLRRAPLDAGRGLVVALRDTTFHMLRTVVSVSTGVRPDRALSSAAVM